MKLIFSNVKKAVYTTAFLLLVCNLCLTGYAQDTEYWFVAPDASNQHGGCDRPTFIMITTGSEPANVTISMPKNSGFADQTRYIGPNDYWKYTFGPGETYNVEVVENAYTSAGSITNKGIHIKSDSGPISVYYQVDGSCSKDIFTLKGEKAFGTEFYTPFQSKYSRTYTDSYAQIHIVAIEDNTTVDITPTAAIVGGAANTVKTVTLNRGQSFLVREATHQSKTKLAGTHIKTRNSKQIAVTVVDDCLQNGGSIDITGDQIVPINNLGTSYVVIKGFTSGGATDNVYVLAAHNNTKVYLNGSSTAVATLSKGQTYHNDMGASGSNPDALYIRTSQPAYCYQQSAIGNEMGAAALPSMYSITAKKVTFFKQSLDQNQVFLIFRKGKEGTFKINGNTMPVTANNINGLADWQYARVNIKNLTPDNKPCSIENQESIFALGYFTGGTTGTALYGFLSNFGQLEFPKTTYKCIHQSVTLDAGYAKSYQWWKGTVADSAHAQIISTSSSYTVPANEQGYYTVKVNQDPFIVYAQTHVVNDAFIASITAPTFVKKGSANNLSTSVRRDIGKAYAWTLTGAAPATANVKNITGIQWNTTGVYNISLRINNTDLHCDTVLSKSVIVYDIADDYASLPKNQTSTVNVLANDDFSACTPTLEVASNPSHGSASIVNGKVVYTPAAGYTGYDTLQYSVTCNGIDKAYARLYIRVHPDIIVEKVANGDASEPGTAGTFTFKFDDSGFTFEKPLKIHYQLGGTAVCNTDFDPPLNYVPHTNKGYVTLPQGSPSVTLSIMPVDNYIVQEDRTVEVTITSIDIL